MKFKDYLDKEGETPSSWAKKKGLPIVTVWRAATGKGQPNPINIQKLIAATEGEVSFEDLVN